MTEEQIKFARNRIRYWDLSEADLLGWVEAVIEEVEDGVPFEIAATQVCEEEIRSCFFMVLLHVAVEMGLTDEDPKIREVAAMKITSPTEDERKNNTNETTKPQDDSWGVCPTCLTGYMCNIERVHFMYCETHRVKWCAGENLFSFWRYESKDVWRANHERLKDFREIKPHRSWLNDPALLALEPWRQPCSCERCIAPVLEALSADPRDGQPRNEFDADDD